MNVGEITTEDVPEIAAANDARLFGIGFTRIHPDGHVEYLPVDQVRIHGRTSDPKTLEERVTALEDAVRELNPGLRI